MGLPGGFRPYLLCIFLIHFLLCPMFSIRTQLSVFMIITPALVGEAIAIAMHSLCLLLLLLTLLAGGRGSGFAPGGSSRF